MTIIWSRRAIGNLADLRAFIARDRPAGADAVANRILDAVEVLATHPEMGRAGRVPGTRELVVAGTPYVIPYRVRDRRLGVIAVFHGRQRWPAKLE